MFFVGSGISNSTKKNAIFLLGFCVVHKQLSKEDVFFSGTNLHNQTCNLERTRLIQQNPLRCQPLRVHKVQPLHKQKNNAFHFEVKQTFVATNPVSPDLDESLYSFEKIFKKKSGGSQRTIFHGSVEDWAPGITWLQPL